MATEVMAEKAVLLPREGKPSKEATMTESQTAFSGVYLCILAFAQTRTLLNYLSFNVNFMPIFMTRNSTVTRKRVYHSGISCNTGKPTLPTGND